MPWTRISCARFSPASLIFILKSSQVSRCKKLLPVASGTLLHLSTAQLNCLSSQPRVLQKRTSHEPRLYLLCWWPIGDKHYIATYSTWFTFTPQTSWAKYNKKIRCYLTGNKEHIHVLSHCTGNSHNILFFKVTTASEECKSDIPSHTISRSPALRFRHFSYQLVSKYIQHLSPKFRSYTKLINIKLY